MNVMTIHNDFVANKNNSLVYKPENAESRLKISNENKVEGIMVTALPANNEDLPFEDGSFNSYISSFSLMLVDNYKNMLNESFRVLKSGGIAGFSVWGRKEHSPFFTLVPEVMAKHGIIIPESKRTNFHLGASLERMVEEAKEAGFERAKVWYQPCVPIFKTSEEVGKFYLASPSHITILSKVEEGVREQVKKDLVEEIERRYFIGNEVLQFEALMLIAYKK